ncbi:MAG: cell division protein ZapA [Endomicrobia bacterium]|nr:cell division protein ZapA [Endomicrobiia bacterium]MCL2799089.1 cell division protein ZapA [Endomicrobiia bacterium]
MDNKINTRIMGIPVSLNLEEMDDLSFSAVERRINDTWQEVKKDNPDVVDSWKTAILTVVKITKELNRLENLQGNISDSHERKMKELIRQLDEVNYPN